MKEDSLFLASSKEQSLLLLFLFVFFFTWTLILPGKMLRANSS